jgi:hypothetical protein
MAKQVEKALKPYLHQLPINPSEYKPFLETTAHAIGRDHFIEIFFSSPDLKKSLTQQEFNEQKRIYLQDFNENRALILEDLKDSLQSAIQHSLKYPSALKQNLTYLTEKVLSQTNTMANSQLSELFPQSVLQKTSSSPFNRFFTSLKKSLNLPDIRLISSDWRDWAKALLGITGANFIFNAFSPQTDIPLPLKSLGMVGALHFMSNGLTRHKWASFPVIAPFVVLSGMAMKQFSERIEHLLKQKTTLSDRNIERAETMASIGMGLASLLLFLPLHTKLNVLLGKHPWWQKTFGLQVLDEAINSEKALAGGFKDLLKQLFSNSALMTCPQKCCTGTLLCVQQVFETIAVTLGIIPRSSSSQESHSHV